MGLSWVSNLTKKSMNLTPEDSHLFSLSSLHSKAIQLSGLECRFVFLFPSRDLEGLGIHFISSQSADLSPNIYPFSESNASKIGPTFRVICMASRLESRYFESTRKAIFHPPLPLSDLNRYIYIHIYIYKFLHISS